MAATTSFFNTPQAGDDTYFWIEDELLASGLLSSVDSTHQNVLTLNVMSNDLGGKAQTLFSIDDGNGHTSWTDYDLLSADPNGVWESTSSGDQIRIYNGQIQLDLSASLAARGATDINSLAAGDHIHNEFVYTVRLGNGALTQATVTVDIYGQNDTAAIMASAQEDTSVTEAGGASNTIPGDSSASGQLMVLDPDHSQNRFQTIAAAALVGNYGNFIFDSSTGAWTYTLDQSKTDPLTAGRQVTDMLTVTSLDGTASQTITVNITGSNDAPVAQSDSYATNEDAALTIAAAAGVLANDSDIDSPSLSAVLVSGPAHGSLTLNSDGSFSYTPSADYNGADSFTYRANDGNLDGNIATVNLTINSVNDAPAFVGDPAPLGPPVLGEHSLTVQASLAFADVDLADWHWADIELLNGGLGYVGSLGASIPGGNDSTGVGAGSLLLTYTLTEEDFLAHQDSLLDEQDYRVTLYDNHGAAAAYTVHLPLAEILGDVLGGGGGGGGGGNANPVILGGDLRGQIFENPFVLGGTQPSDILMASGTIYFSDADSGQHHSVSFGDPIALSHSYYLDPQALLDPPLIGVWSAYVVEPNAGMAGEVHWSYFLSETAARSLAQDEVETVVFPFTLGDDHGGHVTQDVIIDLFGTNEPPFLVQSDFTLFEYGQMVPYLLPPDELTRIQTQPFSIDEDPNVTGSGNVHQLSGTIVFADPDRLNHPTVTFAFDDLRTGSEEFNALIPSLTSGFHYTIDSHDNNTGTIYWYYDVPDNVLDFLAEGQSTHVTGSFVISEIGGSAMATLDIALNGANDPVVIRGPSTTNVTYNVADHGTSSGTFIFNDPDWWPEGHTVAFVPKNPGSGGLSHAGGSMFGGTGVESGAGGDEPVVWNYTISDQSITSGGEQHDVWDLIVSDNFGSTVTYTLDFLLV